MAGEDFPAPSEGFVLTHLIVAEDVARSRDFYTGVLGGTVVLGRRADDRQAGQRLVDHQRRRRADRRQARGRAGTAD
jgi:catechol 2,3-dioxygenase-like lactoylglutathione lyase family enzyme